MDECEEALTLRSCHDASEVPEFVAASLDTIARPIGYAVMWEGYLARTRRGEYRFGTHAGDALHKSWLS